MFSSSNMIMNDVFTLPQMITTVGTYFASTMFDGCSGATFTMGAAFNLPQQITEAKQGFVVGMFSNCSGNGFKINNIFKFPNVGTSIDVNYGSIGNTYPFYYTFYGVTGTQNLTTLTNIINGNQVPASMRNAFRASLFTDGATTSGYWTY
jgi:hypothetical protein